MSNRIRYTVNEVQRNVYYQMPKFLFAEEFNGLNNDARVLYSLLRDRHELSIKNQWVNKNNEIYLIYSREDMCTMLGLSDKTVTKAINNLKKFRLIEEERQGLGKPNKIYLLTTETCINTKNRKISGSGLGESPVLDSEDFRFLTRKISGSGLGESPVLDSENFRPNKIKGFKKNRFKKNRFKKILSNPILSKNLQISKSDEIKSKKTEKTDEKRFDETHLQEIKKRLRKYSGSHMPEATIEKLARDIAMEEEENKKKDLKNAPLPQEMHSNKPSIKTKHEYDYTTVTELVKSQISYNTIIHDRPASQELVDEIVEVIVTTICSKFADDKIQMKDQFIPADVVKGLFWKLDTFDIIYFLDSFEALDTKVIKLVPYIRTSLFVNKQTISHHYSNRVKLDMIKRAEEKQAKLDAAKI